MPTIAEDIFYDATQSPPSIMCFGDSLEYTLIPQTRTTMEISKKKEGAIPTSEDYFICGGGEGRFKHILEVGLEHHPKTPSGWNGPHLLNATSGNVKGADGKFIKFQDFEEAISVADRMKKEDCGGITLKYGGKGPIPTIGYYLTKTRKLRTTEPATSSTYTSQIMCWIKE